MKWCTLLLLAALPLAAQDSPLVAAAKRAKQSKKKATMVITNETLVRSGGHLTTTARQPALSGMPRALRVERQAAAPAQTAAAIEAPPSSARPPRDDAEVYELDEDARRDAPYCPTCLPLLEPSPTLTISKAELSSMPPHQVEPLPPPVVPPQVPKP